MKTLRSSLTSGWTVASALVREQDGEVLENGSMVYTGWYDLGLHETAAHPQRLVALIRARLDETS
ncbi:hypothetical protein ACIO87_35795 [Streptomyces sp. NPDC087218]|uniref:hypothetical protein n=1 Tax=Streptomyces sp. NPDC087218 TaxID=3365769 RepID=UPI00381B0224